MKDLIKQEVKRWNWKSQIIGEGEDSINVSEVIARIERGYYQTKEIDLDLQVFNLRTDHFKCDTLFEFLTHMEMVNKSQLKYPVIVNREGQVIDGRHRICKAIMNGNKSIKGIMILDDSVI